MKEVSRARVLMGTLVSITARHPGGDEAGVGAVLRALEAMQRVGQLMHPTHAGSDLHALDAEAPGRTVRVHPWTLACLQASLDFYRASRGRFDVVVPDDSGGSSADLELQGLHVVRHKPVQIDLGGIAKGFAVDRAIESLQASGCSDGIVNAGGDLRGFGLPWPVELRMSGINQPLELENQALAVSDPTIADRPAEHRGYYRRGSNPYKAPAVAVIARDATSADALTKIVDADIQSAEIEVLLARCQARIVAAVTTTPGSSFFR